MTEKLLAPNGKESNLTPEQYLLVRTSEFKKWFGDWEKLALTKLYDSGIDEISLKRLEDGVSKVVDSNGEPKVVLHGSKGFYDGKSKNNEEITEFSSSRLIFTTDNIDVAKYFGDFKEYFVNIKNPFVIKEGYNVWSRLDENILIKTLGEKTFIDLVNWEWKEDFQNVSEWEKDAIENEPALITIDSLSIYLKEFKNYDGVIAFDIEETTMNISSNDYIAFEPNQIKLADGRNTTFDGNNPDIRFEEGGYLSNELLEKAREISNKNEYLNCDAFCHRMVDNKLFKDEFEIVPFDLDFDENFESQYNSLIKVLNTGDIIAFGEKDNVRHYAIYLGNDDVIEVEMWGAKPRIFSLKDNLYNYENVAFIYREKNNTDMRYADGGKVIINPTEIECHNCHWEWKVKNGGNDLFICHKCNYDNSKFYKFEGLQGEKILDTIAYKKGGRTIAQTPAPKKERIYGSEKNKPESSKDTKSAEKIEFNEKTLETIKNKVAEHNEKNPKKKVTLASAKAVVRRGMGAYSSSHRPTISGGKRNSRVAWGLARLNAFFYKIINGKSKSGKYSQDNDLIKELGYKVKKYEIGGVFHGSSYYFDKFNTDKIGSGIGQQDSGWGIYLTDDKESSKSYGNYIYETTLFEGKKIGEYNFLNENEPVKKDLVRKIVEALYKYYNKEFDLNKFNLYYEYIKDKSLPKVDFNDYELIEFGYSGYLFYKTLSRRLGGDKKASLFLLNNGIDGSIKQLKNHKGEIYRTDYVIYDENAITIENKEHLPNNYYADGGDIQAYEEAMGISQFDEGGETKPKKVYVSIPIKSKFEDITNEKGLWDGTRFQKFQEKTFEDLENGQLIGVIGVSSSPNNVGEWFVHRNCLIVMKYDEFVKLNDFTIIDYDNPEQLMADDMKLFNRLYAGKRDENTDEETLKGQRSNSLYNILKKFNEPFDIAIKKEPNLSKKRGLYRIQYFLNESYDFRKWIIDNNYVIKNPNDLAEKIIEYHYSDDSKNISTFYGNTEDEDITKEYIMPFVVEGVKLAGNVFKSEQEIYLNNKTLNIPSDSQLFFQNFKNQKDQKSNLLELIDKYKLREKYSIYFVQFKDVEKYSLLASQKRTNIAQEKFNSEKKELEIKKDAVVHELLYFFLGESLKSFKETIEKEIAEYSDSTLFYYDYDEERKEIDWYGIILVQAIINKYIEIIQNNWKKWISSQNVKDITIYSFSSFQRDSYYDLVKYFEENKSELEKINDYHNINGNWLSEYRIEYWLKKSVDDYQDMPEWIDHKELAKMYLEKMDAQMYRYYTEDEIPLFSKYKDGGEINNIMKNEIIDVLSKNTRYGKEILSIQEVGLEVIQSCIESNTYFGNAIKQANENYIMIPVNFNDKLWAIDKQVGYNYFSKPNENTKIRVEYKYDLKEYPTPILFDSEIMNNEEFYDVNDYEEINKREFDSQFLYRGINNDEMLSIIENGFIKSNASMNIGKQQEETTSFAQDISQASSYAVGFNAWYDEVTFNKPKYILKVKKEGVNYKPTIETDIENEVDVFGEIPIQQIESIYEFRLGECEMGYVEINVGYENNFSEGSRSPMYKKVFARKMDVNTLINEINSKNKIEKNNDMTNSNPKDTITMDIPLLIRYSELMREDIKSDVALHQVIENLLDIKDKGVLTMSDYDSIVGNVIGTEENPEMESKFEDGGNVESIKSKKGDIKISLDENWYSQDSNVELVPVSELIKFREFDRKTKPKYNKENSVDNINHLKFMFQKEGVKSPLIIEYSADDKSVLIIEGNHRLNSAIDLGMEYLPARVVLKKYGKYHPTKLKSTMQVSGVEPNEYGYIKSDLKPSEVGIEGTKPLVYAEGGIIEGRLHSECGDDGCGRKFQVGEGGHIIEAERDEAVIVADAFDDNEKYTITGTPSEVASALNVMGGGKNFDKGATIEKNGQELDVPQLKKQATDTDVDDIIDSGSIIINRRSMADENEYEVTGTPKQIASAINSIDNNGVVIEKGATIQKG